MTLKDESEKVLEYLKKNGKTSGGQIQSRLGISEGAYKEAKDKLNRQGLVRLGRGRGGTVEAIEGAVAPPEPKKLSQEEVMEIAREEKQAKSRFQKEVEDIRNRAMEIGKREHPDAVKIEVQVWNVDDGHAFVFPWYGKRAQAHEVYVYD